MTDANKKNDASWICVLKETDIIDWQQGILGSEAIKLGITGWILPLAINGNGEIADKYKKEAKDKLLCAPLIELKEELSPAGEQHLVKELRGLWKLNEPLSIWGRPLLVIKGAEKLSHPKFALKRLRLTRKELFIASRDQGDIEELMRLGFDGQIQHKCEASQSYSSNYLLNLKNAHHKMEANGCWIPSVQAISGIELRNWKGASARAYQEWIQQATAWSRIRFHNTGTAPVIIDNWEGHRIGGKEKGKPKEQSQKRDKCRS